MRHTTSIGRKGAQTLYYAVGEHAERIGYPLSHLVTITFQVADPSEPGRIFQRLRLSFFNKWATRPGRSGAQACPPTYAYCFENCRFGTPGHGDDVAAFNIHVHWAVHIPLGRSTDFRFSLDQWLERLGGIATAETAVHIKPVVDQRGLRGYMLKGVNPVHARLYANGRHAPQGVIAGRRTGTSHNLGPSARKAWDRANGVRRRLPAVAYSGRRASP